MSKMKLIEESEDTDSSNDDDQTDFFISEPTDLVADTMGSFGPYQMWLCLVGFLLEIVHCWLSLSLKFVGLVPQFECGEGDVQGEDSCLAYFGNITRPCKTFIFSEEDVVGSIVERWNLVCDKAGLENVAQSVFFSGCLVGVFLSGLMSDLLGRKGVCVVLVITFLISGVWGGLVESWYFWLVLRFVVGAASIGMVTVRYTIQVEMVGGDWRSWANTMTGSGWVVGYMTLPMVAYGVPNMRHLEILIGLAVSPILLMLVFCHPESPRWLVNKGKVKKAIEVLNRVAGWNNNKAISEKELSKFLSSQVTSTRKSTSSANLATLFTSKFPNIRRNLFIMCFCWFSFGMAYFGLALHTPELGSNVFFVFFIGGLMDAPVNIIGPLLLNHGGRKPCMVVSLLIGAVCLLGTFFLPSTSKAIIILALLGKMVIGMSFTTGYVWTTEMFPTVIRNSSLATCSSFARLGAIVAPLIVFFDTYRPGLSILVYGLVVLVGGVSSLGLRPETKGSKAIPDTLEEGEIAAE